MPGARRWSSPAMVANIFGAHGEPTHGMLVFDPAIRVPLVMRASWRDTGGPRRCRQHHRHRANGARPRRSGVHRHRSQSAGTSEPEDLRPQDLRTSESYAESEYPRVAGWAPARTLVRDRWKMIVSDRPALFNLADDPDEQRDLSASQPALAKAMSARLDTLRAASKPIASSAVSPEQRIDCDRSATSPPTWPRRRRRAASIR